MQTPPIEYLYDPELVAERLASLPRMQALLRDAPSQAAESIAFPKLRKTRREILRVLGRHHLYDHLDRLLNEIERLLDRSTKRCEDAETRSERCRSASQTTLNRRGVPRDAA